MKIQNMPFPKGSSKGVHWTFPKGMPLAWGGKSKNAFGKSKNAFGKSKNGFGKSKNGFGKSKNALGNAKNALGKTKHALGKTKYALPRESFGSGRPNMLFPGNPLDREDQKCYFPG